MGEFLGRVRAFLPASAARLTGATPLRGGQSFSLVLLRSGWVFVLVASSLIETTAWAGTVVRLDYNWPLGDRLRRTTFIELFDDRPLTRANFLQYVDGGHYDGSLVHRLARDFALQAGGYIPEFQLEPNLTPQISLNPNKQVDLDNNPATPLPTVVNEYGNAPTRSNVKGTIAMARIGGQPNSADSEWFVNLGNNTFLDNVDGGFTVFGHVLGDGMTLYNTYNVGLAIVNLNQDIDDNGERENGGGNPFWGNANDGVPVNGSYTGITVIEKAKRVDYLGNGLATHVPAEGLTFATNDSFIDTGTTFTGTGALSVAAGRTLGIREGFSLGRDLINRGTLAPGLELGSITVSSFLQFSTGVLDIQLNGTIADTRYDRLVATNSAFLAGKLDVSFVGGFNPVAGNSFTVLTAGSITGNFNSIELPMLTAGLVWNLSRSATAIALQVAAADFNKDGIVDSADYVVWRKTDGSAAGYNLWRANLGNIRGTVTPSSGSGSFAVPEPSSALLLILSAGFFLMIRRYAR